MHRKVWVVTVQHLQGLNIFAITELTIATLFDGVGEAGPVELQLSGGQESQN